MKGHVVISASLEEITTDLYYGKVPSMWMSRSYPSLKPLSTGFEVRDLVEGANFLDRWIESSFPHVFWISGFYFTQSFLTGVLQNFARKFSIPIDTITLDIEIISKSKDSIRSNPEDGAYIHGIFIEACKWDMTRKIITESDPKFLFTPLPVIHLKPKELLIKLFILITIVLSIEHLIEEEFLLLQVILQILS